MRKIIPVVVAGATALAVAGGTYGYATVTKGVTLSVDGAATELSTRGSTVGDVLADRGITLGAHDVVAPAAATKLAEGTRIAVQYGRQLTVTIDGKRQTYWTTATRVDRALGALGINATGAALSTSRSSSIGREGLAFSVATRKQVEVTAAGKKRTITTTAQTLGQALAAAKITVDGNDLLSRPPSTRLTNGAKFTVTQVDVETVTRKRSVDFTTVYKSTDKLRKGTTRVDTSGREGTRTLKYREVRHNGDLESRTKVSSKITREPVSRVILVGTKVVQPKPAPEPERSSSSSSTSRQSGSSSSRKSSSRESSSSSRSSAPSVASGSVWDRLAQCESGGDWSINTGNGFYGGLQFTLSTWRAYGGSGMPHEASREQQIAVAKRVQAGQGWGAWPACTAKLGIR